MFAAGQISRKATDHQKRSPIFSQTPLYKGMIILKLGLYPKLP
jgi:hypothetical protein